jgi:hypothetical protein
MESIPLGLSSATGECRAQPPPPEDRRIPAALRYERDSGAEQTALTNLTGPAAGPVLIACRRENALARTCTIWP